MTKGEDTMEKYKDIGVVHKYPLKINEDTKVSVPFMSQFLSVQSQHNEPVAYFLVNKDAVESTHRKVHKFKVMGTGIPFELRRDMMFVDTLMTHDDHIVLHVFRTEDGYTVQHSGKIFEGR